MEEGSIIGLDSPRLTAPGRTVGGLPAQTLSRGRLLRFLVGQPPCIIAVDACASPHHWGRAIGELGHAVRLIPPASCEAVPEEIAGLSEKTARPASEIRRRTSVE